MTLQEQFPKLAEAIDRGACICCQTQGELDLLYDTLHEMCKTWISGKTYKDYRYNKDLPQQTIATKSGTFSSKAWYVNNGKVVIDLKDLVTTNIKDEVQRKTAPNNGANRVKTIRSQGKPITTKDAGGLVGDSISVRRSSTKVRKSEIFGKPISV